MENWKSIKGYESIYEVSDLGRVKRVFGNVRILKNKKKGNGYLFVGLSYKGIVKYFHIHRLVAEAFIENKENKPCVNHKDLDKENNTIKNLEWVTYKENSAHAFENIKFKRNQLKGLNNKLSVQVSQYLNGKQVYVWESYSSAAKYYGVSSSCISKSILKNTISIGFTWRKCSKNYYLTNKNKYKKPPKLIVDKRKRDTSKARIQKIKNISSKYTNSFLIEEGLKCFKQNNNLTRKIWDNYAKKNKILTYIPVSNRFNGFINFKEEVFKYISR